MKNLNVLKWYRGYLISIFISSSEHQKCDTRSSFCTKCINIKLLTVFEKRTITPDSNEPSLMSQLCKSAWIIRFEQRFNSCYIHVHVFYELLWVFTMQFISTVFTCYDLPRINRSKLQTFYELLRLLRLNCGFIPFIEAFTC